MAGTGPTVTLNFAGDASSLRRTLNEVTIGLAVIGGAGVAGAAGLAAVPLGFAAIGIAAVKDTEKVKTAFDSLKTHVITRTRELAAPFEETLVGMATRAQESFDRISPSLGRIFSEAAPQVDRLATSILTFVERAMPGFERATIAATPVINALATGIENLAPKFNEFFAILSDNAPVLTEAMRVFFEVLGNLLPVLAHIIVFLAQFSAVLLPLAPYIMAVVVGVRILMTLFKLGSAIVRGFQVAWLLLNLAMRANPIFLIITLLGLLVAGLIYAWNNSETFRNIVTTVWNVVKAAITQAVARIRLAIEWFKNLPTMVSDWFQRAKDAAIEKFTQLVNWLRELPGRIKSAVGNLGTLLLNAGRDLITGLWNGIQRAASWLRTRISNFFGSLLPGWAKDFLGIGSPSKVFRDEIGKWIPEGMAVGIEANTKPVENAISRLTNLARSEFGSGMNSMLGDQPGSGQQVNVYITQTAGSPAETGRMVALALRTVG